MAHISRKQRGVFSVELGLALLIGSLIIAAAAVFFSQNMRKTSLNTNVQYIQMIAGNAKTTYGQRGAYGDVTTAVAVRSRVIPAELRDGTAATATNPYGGVITVAPANGTGVNDLLVITWPNVPANQCNDLVTAISRDMRRITVNGVEVKPLDAALNNATTATNCEAADSVPVVFSIGRS
jgi:hypothetical protein